MDLKFCKYCGSEINAQAKLCSNCKKDQRNFFLRHKFLSFLIILIFIGFISGITSNQYSIKTNSSSVSNKNVTATGSNDEKDKSKIIYEDNEFIVKITDYKYSKFSDKIEFYIYIENNSQNDTSFSIDGDVSVNGYMVNGGHFYETVNSQSKANKSFGIWNLKSNGITIDNLSTMSFKFDIYQSENYYIKNRILDNYDFTYEF